MAAALPYALDLGGNIMVGSNEEIRIDVPAWTARLEQVASYYGPEVAAGIRERLALARRLRGNLNTRRGLNLDLFPRDEFSTPVARADAE
jgi:hypothetical protein